MLTVQKLELFPVNYIFAKGVFKFGRHSIREYKWVATTGTVNDWCIYYGDPNMNYDEVVDMGIKLYDERQIKDLVPHDYSSFKFYRY